MPADQETRIVEMRFNNRDFERNIAKSKKSLEDFKKELKFEETSKGLREFTSNMNSIDFHGLSSNIQRLTDKFTGLGNAGEWVLSRIRNSLEGAALQLEGFLKSFTTAQITVGQSKYDALNKAVQGIVATGEYTEKQAYSIFSRVMEYTDQTSANFQTMVDQISSFVAAGQGLATSEKAMEGIFNMTSKAGKGAMEASSAMETFSKAMGAGYLDLNKWNSLNLSAHIITADFRKQIIAAAVATGNLIEKQGKYYTNGKKFGKQMEVTADNLENTLHKKWLTKDTMMAVFDKYYFEKLTGATEEELESFAGVAYKSAQRALTFADAMNAIKESVSSGWLDSFRLVFGDLTDAMEFFTNLCERVIIGIEGIKNARNDILRVWSSGGGRSSLIETILGDYGKDVETGAYGLLDLFDDIGSIISEGFWDMAKIFANDEEFTLGNWDEEGFKEAWLGRKLRDFTENIRDFVSSIKGFFTEEVKVGDETKTRIQMVGDVVAGVSGALALGIDLLNGISHFANGLREQLQPTIDTVRNFFAKLGVILYDTAEEAHQNKSIIAFFDGLLSVLQPITSAINIVTQQLAAMLLAFVLWGKESGFFASVMGLVSAAIGKIGAVVTKIAVPIFNFFGKLFGAVTELFQSGLSTESIEKFKATMVSLFKDTKKKLEDFFKSINFKEKFINAYTIVSNFFKQINIPGLLGKAVAKVKKYLEKIDINSALIKIVSKVWAFLKTINFKDGLSNVADNMSKNVPGIFTKVIDRIRKFFSSISNPFAGGKSIFEQIISFFKSGYEKIEKFISEIDFSKGLSGIFDKLKETFIDAEGNFKKDNLASVLGGASAAIFGAVGLFKLIKKIRETKNGVLGAVQTVSTVVNSTQKGIKMATVLKIAAVIGVIGTLIHFFSKIDFVKAFGQFKELARGIKFGDVLKKVFDYLKKVITDIGNWLKGSDIKSVLQAAFQIFASIEFLRLIKAVRYATNELGYVFENITKKLKGKKSPAASLKTFALSLLEIAISVGIIAYSMNMLGTMKPEDLTRGAIAVGATLAALIVLGKVAGKKDSKIPSASSLMGVAAVVYSLGLSIERIAKSLLPFAEMSIGKIVKVLLVVAAMFVPLVMITKEVSWFDRDRSGGFKGLALLVASIGFLLSALLPYSLIPWPNLFRMAVALGGIMILLTLFAGSLKLLKLTSSELKGLAATSAAIGILALSMIPYAFFDWPQLAHMAAGLGGIMVSLLAFSWMLKLLKIKKAAISGVIGLSVAIGIIALALMPLALISWPNLGKMGAGLLAIVVSLGAVAAVIGGFKVSKGQLVGVLAVAGGIVMVALALLPFAAMDRDGMIKAGIALVAVAGVLALFIFAIQAMNVTALIGKQILSIIELLAAGLVMIAMVTVVTEALRKVKDIPESLMTSFFGGLALMVAVMAGIIVVLGSIPITTGLQGILLIAGAILAIAGILSVAIPMFLDAVGTSITDFTAKLLLVSDMMEQFATKINAVDETGIDKADVLFEKLKLLLGKIIGLGDYNSAISNFTTAIYDLGTGMEIFNNHVKDLPDPETGFAFKIVDKLVSIKDALSKFSIGNFADEIYGLGLGLYAFDYLGSDMGDPASSKPMLLLTELAGCADDLETLAGLGLDQLKSQLAGLGGAMMLYAEGAKEVTGIEGDQTGNISGAVSIMSAITKAFSEEGGFKLPDIPKEEELGSFGSDLAALAGAIVKFSEASNGLGDNTDKAVELLDFIGGDLKSKLTADNLAAANAFKDAGITPYTLTAFGLEIIGLGTAIAAFADSTKNVDEGKLKNAEQALGFFAKLRGALITEDSIMAVVNAFTGDAVKPDQLVEFGKNIEQLGLSLQDFAGSVTWNDEKSKGVEEALKSLDSLQTIKTKLSEVKVGGLVNLVAGRATNLIDLSGEIVTLGNALNGFSASLTGDGTDENKGIDSDKMTEALGVLDNIVDFLGNGENGLQSKMGNVGGALEWFTGKHYDATALAEDMTGFKSAMGELVSVSNMLTGADGEGNTIDGTTIKSALGSLDNVVAFITRLQETAPRLGGLEDIGEWLLHGDKYSTDTLKTDMSNIGEAIGAFSTGIGSGFNPDNVNAAVGVVGAFADILTSLTAINGENYMATSEYIYGLKQLMMSMNDQNWINGDEVKGAVDSIVYLMSMISTAIDDAGNIKVDDINMFTQMAQALKHLTEIDPTFNFVVVGESIANGVATGITNTTSKVTEAARSMAISAYNAAMNELRAHSPSKLFQDVGGFITAGLSIGIDKGSGQVQNSIIDMSQDTLNNAMTVLGVISQMMSEDLDANPTITPVLDLTNLSSGIGTMNDLLGNRGMTINTGLASRLAASNIPTANRPEINQSTVDYSGIYERMAALGETVAALGDQIAQMKIVLDSGAIAGAVTDAVDDAIGAKTFYAGRGN